MDWSTLDELSEAIPPAYAEFVGHQLMQHVRANQPSTTPTATGNPTA